MEGKRKLYSFLSTPALAAFFSLCSSFFCLLDLGAAFCVFRCSLFATSKPPDLKIQAAARRPDAGIYLSTPIVTNLKSNEQFKEEEFLLVLLMQ
jgi:hypothetical protein